MNYYIKTKKDCHYELSEIYSTKIEAENKLQHLHKNKRLKSSVIELPEIKNGLILYKNDSNYWSTIISTGKSLYFLQKDPKSEEEISSPMLKENLINYYLEGKLLSVEEYYEDENVKFEDIQDLSGYDDDNLKEED